MLSVIIHPQDSKLAVLPIKDNAKEPVFYGILTLKRTPKGARWQIQDKAGRKGRLHGARGTNISPRSWVGYGGKTYYPANIMNIQNEKRNKRTDYS